jgi:hypothetical protein
MPKILTTRVGKKGEALFEILAYTRKMQQIFVVSSKKLYFVFCPYGASISIEITHNIMINKAVGVSCQKANTC